MKFGVREICNVVFRAKSAMNLGTMKNIQPGQPVLYIDTATTSTLEGTGTTVYAQGGRGNTRLIAWEGEKTLTFTVEDALLSPIGFAMLSGAGLISNTEDVVHTHQTSVAYLDANGIIDLRDALTTGGINEGGSVDTSSPVYVMLTEEDGSLKGMSTYTFKGQTLKNGQFQDATNDGDAIVALKVIEGVFEQSAVLVDYYVKRKGSEVSEIQIDAENFAGYYYVEADTLFRRQDTGRDMPANITLPNVKIQSNFTFTMASTGDPSTFSFTMDAFPGYTYFDKTKKVLCVIQVINDEKALERNEKSVMLHDTTSNNDKNISGTNASSGNVSGYSDTDSVPDDNGSKEGN